MARKANPDYWQQQLSNQSSSGLTQAQWCEQNNINIHNFRYWKNRLSSKQQKASCDSNETKWALVTSSEHVACDDTKAPSLRIHVGKALIEVSDGFDYKILSDFVTVLMKHV